MSPIKPASDSLVQRQRKTNDQEASDEKAASAFNPLPLILVVAALFLVVSLWTSSYTETQSLHRYCGIQEQTIGYLHKVLTEREPAGDDARRPYLIAAKLIFLLPQYPNEGINAYTNRVRSTIEAQCR